MEAVLDEPYILLTDKKITLVQDLVPVLEQVARAGKPLNDHCRRHRERSPGHPGGEPHAWGPEPWLPLKPLALAIAVRPCWKISPC